MRPQEPPPPTPTKDSHHHTTEVRGSSPQIAHLNHQSPDDQSLMADSDGTKRNSTAMMITNEDAASVKSGARSAGIDNPGFQEDERPATIGNGGGVFISVTTPSNGDASFLNCSAVDTSMLTEMKDADKKKDKEISEAVNLELVSMNPFSTSLDTNCVNGIPMKQDSEQAGISDGYNDPYDEYFVPVNEHRKYMRGEKLYVTKDKRQSQSWRRCICWGIGFVLLSVAILIAVLAGTGVILSQENQALVTETETSRQLFSSGRDSPRTGGSSDRAAGRSEPPPPEISSFTPPPPFQSSMPSMPTTDLSQLYVPRVVEGELVIDNMEFNPGLSMSESEEFQELASSVEAELKKALFDIQTLNYGAADIFIKVVGFSPGSIVVNFRIGWEFKEGIKKAPDPIEKDAVRQRLERQLNLEGGLLGTYHVPVGSIRASRLLDMCQFNNGECSHDCTFDYWHKLMFVCVCPASLHLDESGKNCTHTVEAEAPPMHRHEPVSEAAPEPSPQPVPEPAPEPSTEVTKPIRTSTTSTTPSSSYNVEHHMISLPEHTTPQLQHPSPWHPDYITEIPTAQSSSTEHNFHHGHSVDEHVPVTTVMVPSEPENVSFPQLPEIPVDYEFARNLLPQHQRENETLGLPVAEGSSTEMTENTYRHFSDVPASVHMVYYDDTTHPDHAAHSPLPGHELHDGPTSSPHFHKETQTLIINVADGNSSQMTPHEHSLTEFPDDITRHEINESNVMMSSHTPESLPPHESEHDHNNIEASTVRPKVFSPSNEINAGVGGLITTDGPVTLDPQEQHTVIPAEMFGEHAENDAEPTDYPFDMEKKGGIPHNVHESITDKLNSSTSKKPDRAESLENSAEEPMFLYHDIKMDNETEISAAKLPPTEIPTDIPVRIVNTGDANSRDTLMTGHADIMPISGVDNTTEMMPGSQDEKDTILATEIAGREEHEHGGLLFNDVYFPDSEHAENGTFLNALSPEDDENRPLRPATVSPIPAMNTTGVPSPNLKKGPRLDDDEMYRVNPNEELDHRVTSEPTVESVPVIAHDYVSVAPSSAAPVMETSPEQAYMSENEHSPPMSEDNFHPNFTSATEVPEGGNATFETHLEATNGTGSASVVVVGHEVMENASESAVRNDLSEMLKGTDKEVMTDDIVTERSSQDVSDDMITFPAATTTTDVSLSGLEENIAVFGTEIPAVKPEEVYTENTMTDMMTTVPEAEFLTTPESTLISTILVHDSRNSSESNTNSSPRENTIEEGEMSRPGLWSTTTEHEVDHPLTVAPLPEHHDNETTMPGNLHKDRDIYRTLKANETMVALEQSVEITTQVDPVDITAKSLKNDEENSTVLASDTFTTQSVIHMLTPTGSPAPLSESSSEPNSITTTILHHEENDISSSAETNGKKTKINTGITEMPGNKQPDATQPENEALASTVQNETQNGGRNLLVLLKDSVTTTDSTDKAEKDDVINNVTVSKETSSPILHVSSDEVRTSSTSPDILVHYQDAKLNETEEIMTTETPTVGDNEAEDIHLFLHKLQEDHVNTVKPLPHNNSSTQTDQETIVLGSTNSTDANPHGILVTDHINTAFEKPHEFTDIENRLLIESRKFQDVSISSTPEYANDIHALPPSGGGNVIPPTAQSVVLVDPITGEIQKPTSVGQLKNETLLVTTTEDHSAVEHDQKSENLATLKVDKDISAASISKSEPKKKDLLNSSVNKKPMKSMGETSTLQGETEQVIPDKSAVNLLEKKTVDKLQKFDKDNSKKIDKVGFGNLPLDVSDEQAVLIEDMDRREMSGTATSASTTAVPLSVANSTTEESGLADTGSRPIDEEDENENPFTDIQGDIEQANTVEPQNLTTKEKKSDAEEGKASEFEGATLMNESVTVGDHQHISARSDSVNKTENVTGATKSHTESSIAIGIEPAISRGTNETSILTETLLTPRILPASENLVPDSTKNKLGPSSDDKVMITLSADESLLSSDNQDANLKVSNDSVRENTTLKFDTGIKSGIASPPPLTSESSNVIADSVTNSSFTNISLEIVTVTPQEGNDTDAPTMAHPSELSVNMTVETSSKSPEIPASVGLTLNNNDFARLHKAATVSLEDGHSQNLSKDSNTTKVTEDSSEVGHNILTHQWTSENGTYVGGFVSGEAPMAFSKCASGQFQCINGTSHDGAYCVSQVAKCDSVNDCSDASDEMGCVEEGCPGNFQCSSGQCLKRHLVCNGIVDCNDGSDEVNCDKWQCQFDEFQCPSGRCIPFLWHCDGKPDCDNHTDEYNCMSSCGNDEYLCPEHWCIPMTWRCNGIAECANGEDEKLCDCSLDQFHCNAGGCVLKTQVCDGVEQCPDMSDEWGCIRLHNDTMKLQIRSAEGTWHPVCGDNWDSSWSDLTCQSLGYSKAVFTEILSMSDSVSEYYALKPGSAAPLAEASSRLSSSLQKSNNESACTSSTVVEVSCQEFTCGSHGLADGVAARLVGGDGATNGQWPSVALLYHTRHKSSCTASIISPKWLLSSYSCLHLRDKTLTADSWVAFGGGSMFETDKPETQIREVRSIISYPQVKYNQFLYNNDIALIELSQPLMFTRYVGAICLPEKEIEPRQLCVTAGWGYTSPGEINFSQYLHYLPVPTIDLKDCNSTKHYAGFITNDEICAGFTDAEKSPCYNDEGAPLMCVSEGGVWELQGVLSYHSNCGQGYHPSIFSSITAVRGWVEKTVGSHFERKSTFNVRRRRGLETLILSGGD